MNRALCNVSDFNAIHLRLSGRTISKIVLLVLKYPENCAQLSKGVSHYQTNKDRESKGL